MVVYVRVEDTERAGKGNTSDLKRSTIVSRASRLARFFIKHCFWEAGYVYVILVIFSEQKRRES